MTGAEGFVGGHLVQQLLDAGHSVTASSLAAAPDADAGSGSPDRVELDVLDGQAVREVVSAIAPDVVFHLAGFSSGARARHDPGQALRVNAEGTLSVVSAVADLRPGARVVVTGSADVYGDPGTDPVTEDAPLRPVSAYGVSKAAQELVALGIGRERGVDVRVARMFPMVGPGQSEAFVVPSFCRQAAAIARGDAEPVLRVGNLHVERDFTDVRDGAAGLRAIAGMDESAPVAYNVCSGTGTSIRELLRWVLDAAGIDPEIEVDPERVRSKDPARIVGSPDRLGRATGWEPRRDVREGVRDTYSWVRTVQ